MDVAGWIPDFRTEQKSRVRIGLWQGVAKSISGDEVAG
jgi:hypothetical protein